LGPLLSYYQLFFRDTTRPFTYVVCHVCFYTAYVTFQNVHFYTPGFSSVFPSYCFLLQTLPSPNCFAVKIRSSTKSNFSSSCSCVVITSCLLLVILYLSGACYDGANDVDVQSGGSMARSSMSSMAMLPPTATGNSYYSGARPNFSQPPSVSQVISSTENLYVSHIIFIQLYIFVFCALYIFSFFMLFNEGCKV